MSNTLLSGHIVRHNKILIDYKNDDKQKKQLIDKLKNLNKVQKHNFKKLCNKIVIGLRDRYSGNQLENGNKKLKLFSVLPTQGNLHITQEGTLNLLKKIYENFDNNDAKLVISLCTHRHTSTTKIAKYPRTLEKLFEQLRINVSTVELLNLKNKIEAANTNIYNDPDFLILAGKNLASVNLEYVNLENVNLGYVNLEYVNLRNANLFGANLKGVNLKGADLRNIKWTANFKPEFIKEVLIKLGIRNQEYRKILSKLKNKSQETICNVLTDYFLATQSADDRARIDLSNFRKARIDLHSIMKSNKWNAQFEKLTGKPFIEFQIGIYGKSFKTTQKIQERHKKYEISENGRQNKKLTLVQDSYCSINNEKFVKCTVKTSGTNTYSSNAQQKNPELFNSNNSNKFIGINVNKQNMTIMTKNTNEAMPTKKDYSLSTVGSYQINNHKVIDNAKLLLNTMVTDKTRFIVDFKPLKLFGHDQEIFQTHTEVMKQATNQLNTQNKSNLKYIGVCGSSFYDLKLIGTVPESNKQLNHLLTFFEENIQNQDAHYRIFQRLKFIIQNTNNFRSMSRFILIFSLIRILSNKFPDKIVIMGGCMSAKDRMGALTHASNLIIQLYHINEGSLDFIDNNGKLIKKTLTESQLDFIKSHINNIAGLNILSEMGIGKFNNKNIYLFASIFGKIEELHKLVCKKTLVITSA